MTIVSSLGRRMRAQREKCGADENCAERGSHQRVNVPVECGGDGVKSGWHRQRQQHRPALLAVLDGLRHGNDKDHAGKFQRAQFDRFENLFERAGVRFEGLNEEVQEDQRPGVNPQASSGGGRVFAQG